MIVVNGINYIDVNEVKRLLETEHLSHNSFFQPTMQKRLKNVRTIDVKNAIYYNRNDVLEISKNDSKEEKLLINAQRLIMLVLDESVINKNQLSKMLELPNGIYLDNFLSIKTKSNEYSRQIWDNLVKLFPEIYKEYMREYYI